MWEPQLRSLVDLHTVIRVDLPGLGNSPIETNPVSARGSVGEALDAAVVGAAHLPNLEPPEEFDRIVLAFLGKHGV